jgi:hypothetical protein
MKQGYTGRTKAEASAFIKDYQYREELKSQSKWYEDDLYYPQPVSKTTTLQTNKINRNKSDKF